MRTRGPTLSEPSEQIDKVGGNFFAQRVIINRAQRAADRTVDLFAPLALTRFALGGNTIGSGFALFGFLADTQPLDPPHAMARMPKSKHARTRHATAVGAMEVGLHDLSPTWYRRQSLRTVVADQERN